MNDRIQHILISFLIILISLSEAQQQDENSDIIECLKPTKDLVSQDGGLKATLEVVNESPLSLLVFWIDNNGDIGYDISPGVISPGKRHTFATKTRHVFRVFDEDHGLLREIQIRSASEKPIVITQACHAIDKEAINYEMESLVHNQTEPCLPKNDSTQWSCIRRIPKNEYQRRLKQFAGTVYGFRNAEESQARQVGDTEDREWSHQIPQIPRLTTGPGFLKMNFTKHMKDILLPWYQFHKKGGPRDSVQDHHVIAGGFTNSHTVTMSMLNLPSKLKRELSNEMRKVLMWWTGQPLIETATFGIRIYHRESLLINHVDRADTHLASAVIQIAQKGIDQGWPLEILHPDNSCSEVYLQPGEMVLYEGARFRHGRPMRLNGTDFANIFSHFRPYDWKGPGKSPHYDGLLDRDGYIKIAFGDRGYMKHSLTGDEL